MKKKFFVFFAVLLSMTLQAADPWDGTTIATSFAGGIGALADPWQISTPAELAYLGQLVAGGNTYSAGKYYILTSDLDLNNKPWTPIGDGITTQFRGTFDGNSHLISNLNVNVANNLPAGLFGMVQNGFVKNVGIVGTSTVTATGTGTAGGIVGQVTVYSATVVYGISNCFSNATVVSAGSSAGGIVGYYYTSVANTLSSINNCYSTGNITGLSNVSGIVGRVNKNTSTGTLLTISNSYATGTLTATSTTTVNLGGIAILSNSAPLNVANCYYINGDAAQANGAIAVTAADMITPDFLTALNNGGTAWKEDFAGSNVNNGFPIHAWRTLSTDIKSTLISNGKVTVFGNTVKIEAPVSIKNMQLYNFSGQLVESKNINYAANHVSFDVQQAGIYLLIAQTAEGQLSQKIIVK